MALGMRIDSHGLAFIENWEAFVGYWYDDKVAPRKVKGKLQYAEYKGGPVRGTLTIGIGHTKAAKANVPFVIGGKMTHEEARRTLDIDLDPCEAAVNKLVKVPLTQGQFNALVSFVYNCGEGNFRKSSVLAKLNRGDYRGARAALALYNKSGGETMLGLKRRRAAEQAMWDEDGEVVAALNPTAKEETQMEVVPKADEVNPLPAVKSTESWASVGQATIGTAGAMNEANGAMDHVDKVIEYKDKAEQLGVEPIALFGKISPALEYLIHRPLFWVFLAVLAIGVFQFFRRRWHARMEASQ